MEKILVVDDDALLRRSLKYRLEREGFVVVTVETGEEALSMARRDPPDLILLDIGLPERDGLEIARTLQRELTVPLIFLTGRRQENDIVIGLELGAEDYITKPFGMRELLARIRVVLRRMAREPVQAVDELLVVGDVWLDPAGREVRVRGEPVDLPPKEFELLRLLLANSGTVLTTNYLLDAVWGEEFAGAVQVLYVHIGWLRELIEVNPRRPQYIQTVRGVGYKFVAPEPGP
ncbi:MAG TPA: response regulator transcription factor [Anaerolineae bacterium]|nr:response regulator transcription factor [Anaerolineae bacterium]